jgi:hypothetical protein
LVIHHGYCAFESVAERVADEFEGRPPRSERWHQDLLDAMASDIPGVRPAVIGRGSLEALHDLLR